MSFCGDGTTVFSLCFGKICKDDVLGSSLTKLLLGDFLLDTGILVPVFSRIPLTISIVQSTLLTLVNGGVFVPQPALTGVLTGGNLLGECLEGTVGFKPDRI